MAALIPPEVVTSRSTPVGKKENHLVNQLLRTVAVNRLTLNDPYRGRTVPLTSKRCILYIYSANVGTAYFKHTLRFFSSKCSLFRNSNVFGSYIHILYTGCAKTKKKKIPAPKD